MLVFFQLLLGRLQARTLLEDDFFGSIATSLLSFPSPPLDGVRAHRCPELRVRVPAALDRDDPHHPAPSLDECPEQYVRYFDLSNQQVFLRMRRRVSQETWWFWADGTRTKLKRLLQRNKSKLPKLEDAVAGGNGKRWWRGHRRRRHQLLQQFVLDQAEAIYRYWPDVGERLFEDLA